MCKLCKECSDINIGITEDIFIGFAGYNRLCIMSEDNYGGYTPRYDLDMNIFQYCPLCGCKIN